MHRLWEHAQLWTNKETVWLMRNKGQWDQAPKVLYNSLLQHLLKANLYTTFIIASSDNDQWSTDF
jgi:hypothetical protein